MNKAQTGASNKPQIKNWNKNSGLRKNKRHGSDLAKDTDMRTGVKGGKRSSKNLRSDVSDDENKEPINALAVAEKLRALRRAPKQVSEKVAKRRALVEPWLSKIVATRKRATWLQVNEALKEVGVRISTQPTPEKQAEELRQTVAGMRPKPRASPKTVSIKKSDDAGNDLAKVPTVANAGVQNTEVPGELAKRVSAEIAENRLTVKPASAPRHAGDRYDKPLH